MMSILYHIKRFRTFTLYELIESRNYNWRAFKHRQTVNNKYIDNKMKNNKYHTVEQFRNTIDKS